MLVSPCRLCFGKRSQPLWKLPNPSTLRYRENTQRIKQKLELYPFKPAEKFVKMVEFAAHFEHLNELSLVGAEFSFVKYFCLDIILPAVLVVVALTVSVAYSLLCIVSRVSAGKAKVE